MATLSDMSLRRFVLIRQGAPGRPEEVAAEGVEFTNGQVVIHWLANYDSIDIWPNVKAFEAVHHDNNFTKMHWVDIKGSVSDKIPVQSQRSRGQATTPYRAPTELINDFSCTKCGDHGWYDTGNGDLICECPAGKRFVVVNGQIVEKDR